MSAHYFTMTKATIQAEYSIFFSFEGTVFVIVS